MDRLDQYVQTFLDIEFQRTNQKEEYERRENLFKRECRNIISKIHKFIGHYFMQVQEQIFDTIDKDYAKWESQKIELVQLRDSENFIELFFRRKEILKSKREMKM